MTDQSSMEANQTTGTYVPTDAELSATIITESRRALLLHTVEDIEDAEQAADEAKTEIARRHPLGKAGREGLPDQG